MEALYSPSNKGNDVAQYRGEKIVGVLHDVVEDSEDWDFDRLREEGFAEDIISALKSVTKQSDAENYEAFIERAGRNQIGRNVKIADIKDNLDVTRIGPLKEKDLLRINKYKNALRNWRRSHPFAFHQKSVIGPPTSNLSCLDK